MQLLTAHLITRRECSSKITAKHSPIDGKTVSRSVFLSVLYLAGPDVVDVARPIRCANLRFWFGPLALKSCCKRFGAMLKAWSLSVRHRENDPPIIFWPSSTLNLRVQTICMPFWCREEVQKTVWETVFPTNTPDMALAHPQVQLIQLLGHARPAIAAKA